MPFEIQSSGVKLRENGSDPINKTSSVCPSKWKHPSVYNRGNSIKLLQRSPSGPCEQFANILAHFHSDCQQDLEICVPEAALSEAVSILCSTRRFRLVENAAYDLFTEYKRGFPTLMAPSTSLLVVLFPDSYFYLLPLRQSIVPFQERLSTTYSRQLPDLFPGDEIRHLPVPYLAAFFIGLCRRFFESNDYMARIAAEQLVDGMDLDEEWVESNLSGAAPEVRELAAQLVAEKSSRYDGYLDFEAPCPSVEDGKMKGAPGRVKTLTVSLPSPNNRLLLS